MRGDNTKRYRVLNLIRRVNLETASPKKRAVIKLLEWQPEAEAIRFEGRCHCKGQCLMSYRLPMLEDITRNKDNESCGYFCPSCHFGNAGSRPKQYERKATRKAEFSAEGNDDGI